MQEKVLAIPTKELQHVFDFVKCQYFPEPRINCEKYIGDNHIFIHRNIAETDIDYKQIIPYAMICHKEKYLLIKRTKKQTEHRLHNFYSLGLGGHINPIDITNNNSFLEAALRRELMEEVFIDENINPEFIAFINDETSDVGKYHLACFFIVVIDSLDVKIKEKDKMHAIWVEKDELSKYYPRMESWSKIIFNNFILKR